MPTYNEERVIQKRINNLLDLDYPKDRYEIIIVESGSADNTYGVVKKFMECSVNSRPDLKLIREQERRGCFSFPTSKAVRGFKSREKI